MKSNLIRIFAAFCRVNVVLLLAIPVYRFITYLAGSFDSIAATGFFFFFACAAIVYYAVHGVERVFYLEMRILPPGRRTSTLIWLPFAVFLTLPVYVFVFDIFGRSINNAITSQALRPLFATLNTVGIHEAHLLFGLIGIVSFFIASGLALLGEWMLASRTFDSGRAMTEARNA
jgi:hypothetical protein